MVIPTEMAGMSADEFKAYMGEWIRKHYGEYLGRDAKLLDLPNGFDLLKQRVEADLSLQDAKVA